MERIKAGIILFIITGLNAAVFADNTQTPRVIPAVKAVNLAPIDTQKQQPQVKAVNLSKPESSQQKTTNVVPVRVQAVPVQTKTEPVKVQAQPVQQAKGASYQPPVQLVAPNGQPVNSLTTPADIESDACVKIFQLDVEELLEYTLAALEANNFTIGEIQSRGGYVTFKAANKEFLATVSEIDTKNSMLKITPANGVYHFAPGIVYKVFEYVTIKMK